MQALAIEALRHCPAVEDGSHETMPRHWLRMVTTLPPLRIEHQGKPNGLEKYLIVGRGSRRSLDRYNRLRSLRMKSSPLKRYLRAHRSPDDQGYTLNAEALHQQSPLQIDIVED